MHPQRRGTVHPALAIVGAIGAIFLVIGLGWWTKNRDAAAEAVRAEGEVIRMVRGSKNGSKPVVRFRAEGRTVEITGLVSSSPPAYSVGEKVAVLYPPGKPEDGWIDSFVETGLFPLIFGGIGGVMVTVCGTIALVSRRNSHRRERIRLQGVSTEGTLVDVRLDGNMHVNNKRRWRLVAEAKPAGSGGPPMRFEDTVWAPGHQPPFPVGRPVCIRYLLENPNECVIDTDAPVGKTV